MAIVISEPNSYDAYSKLVDTFQERMRANGNNQHANFSDEREKGKDNVRRFIAANEHGMIVGWMTIKIQEADLKIEGICTDPSKENSKGGAKALVTKAVNCSVCTGKGGVVTLSNFSKGTGDKFYEYMGFKPIDSGGTNMRLTIDYRNWDLRETGKTIQTKRGKDLAVVEHYRVD